MAWMSDRPDQDTARRRTVGDRIRSAQRSAGGWLAMLCGLSPAAVPADMPASLGLRLVDSTRIADRSEGLTEPSGLAVSSDGRRLWTVSDDEKRIFQLGLDGDLKHSFRIDAKDLEGIAASADGSALLAVREGAAEILVIDVAREEIARRVPLAEMQGYAALQAVFEGGPENKGLEGIAIDPDAGAIFVLKEAKPRLLIELSPDLAAIRSVRTLTAEAGFAASWTPDKKLDVSGLAYDPGRRALWIVSDKGRALFLYDPAAHAGRSVALHWHDGEERRRIKNAEGVAIDPAGSRLFIVNDDGKHSRLFVYAVE